ncbi:hypothetical protein [Streptomyces sp. NPDC002580]|uniref:hypothetical protein n=1 Tax=Streptomyces sp. NPDC002580 TaxID=3364653 RepID=UPI00369F1EC6
MSGLALGAVLALAALAGYAAGRLRPWARLGEWANWQLRFHVDRWSTRPRMAVLAAALIVTDPGGMWHAHRHRNDPGPPPAPPVRIRDVRPD